MTPKFVLSTYFSVDPTEAFYCNLNINEDTGTGPAKRSWDYSIESGGYTRGGGILV
jgi:hypothetical protein